MIFLFGHKGFIGSGIAQYFRDNKIEYTGIDRDNYSDYAQKECDIFINAAGNSRKLLANTDPVLDFQKNVVDTLKTLKDFKFKKYIYLSSIDVYNDYSDPKNNSESVHIDPTKLSNYGFSKYIAEQCVMKYAKEWLILRLGGMVGINLKKNAVYDLSKNKTLYVSPKSEYQYMNTTEVGNIIFKLMDLNHEIFNVCGDGLITPEEIAEMLTIHLDKKYYEYSADTYNINIEKLKLRMRVSGSKDTVAKYLEVK